MNDLVFQIGGRQITLDGDVFVQTAIAAGIIVVSFIAARIVAALTRRIVHHYTKMTETDLDDYLVQAVRTPLTFLVFLHGTLFALRRLDYLDGLRSEIDRTGTALTFLLAMIALQRVVGGVLEWYAAHAAKTTAPGLDPRSVPMVRRVANVVIVLVGVLLILDSLGLRVSPLLAGLGIGGIAVALALQPMLANVFASSYMLSDASIRVGDFIEVEGGPTGWVEDIGWRATRIRTFSNNIVMIPNSSLADSTVTNFDSQGQPVDASVTCGVAYEEDLERVERVCMEELRSIRDDLSTTVKSHEPVFLFQTFGDSNIDFLMKVRASDRRNVGRIQHHMVKRIHARLGREGITINYPARRLFLEPADTAGLDRLRATPGSVDVSGEAVSSSD